MSVDGDGVVLVYTDGACKGNPGRGGWAAIVVAPNGHGRRAIQLAGSAAHTTNNAMELRACIHGVERALEIGQHVRVFTDSQYVQNGITRWVFDWQRRGWQTARGDPVKNRTLWERLVRACYGYGTTTTRASPPSVEWHWVRGHSGHPLNELADRVASQYAAIADERQ